MLKYAGKWQELSVKERLVLMAISYELPNVSGRGVLGSNVASITGFSLATVAMISMNLVEKGLLQVGLQPIELYLSGAAISRDLCGEKLDLFEEAEMKKRMPSPLSVEAPPQPPA